MVIASAEEGVVKPDKKIFETALERSICNPFNAVMISDRIDNDIVPAKLLGMKTIWIKQGFGQYWKISSEDKKADYVVDNLTALCEIFNKGLAPSFNAASRSEAAMKFQLGIEPQLKLNMEPAALEAGDILPKLYGYYCYLHSSVFRLE